MVSGNHWSCVHINLETGDGLYADSIGWEVPRHFGDTFSNYFQAIWKVYKEKTLSNPCTLLMKFNEQKTHINVDIFYVKNVINQRNHMIVYGAAAIFSGITKSDFAIATKIIRKRKITRYCAWMNDLKSYSSFPMKLLIKWYM